MAHGGGGNGRTLVDRRRAIMMAMAGALFKEHRILEESSQPKRAERKDLYFIGKRKGSKNQSNEGTKNDRKPKKR